MGKPRLTEAMRFALCCPTDVWSRWSVTLHNVDKGGINDGGSLGTWRLTCGLAGRARGDGEAVPNL